MVYDSVKSSGNILMESPPHDSKVRLWIESVFGQHFSLRAWKNFLYLGGAHIGVLIAGLASTSLWTHTVSKEIFGQYQLIYSIIAMVSSFSLNGLMESASISAAKG